MASYATAPGPGRVPSRGGRPRAGGGARRVWRGRGGCQEPEDGVVPAAPLDEFGDDPAPAMHLFVRPRLRRGSGVLLSARRRGEDDHMVSPCAVLKRNGVFAVAPGYGRDATGRG